MFVHFLKFFFFSSIEQKVIDLNDLLITTSFSKNLGKWKISLNLFRYIVTKSYIVNRLPKNLTSSIKYFGSLNSSLTILFHLIKGIVMSLYFYCKSN